jgi:N-acetylmuramoyl-L-alanine amidase
MRVKKEVAKIEPKKHSRHIALIVGHTEKKPGAFSPFLKKHEYKYNTEFARLIRGEAERASLSCSIHFRDKGGVSGAYIDAVKSEPACIIELHFNAFNTRVSGSEILINERDDEPGLKERELATTLQNRIASTLGNTNRGIKSRSSKGERGFYSLSRTSKIPSMILEPFFGDNDSDARNFDYKKQQAAQVIVRTTREFMNGH